MSEFPFPVLGTSVPPMMGRQAIIKKMIASLTKALPDHIQMTGPRYAGKTVILHELAARMRLPDSRYSAVSLWNLGHRTPATDDSFMLMLAQKLSSALDEKYPDYAEHLKNIKDNAYQDIAEILELIRIEGRSILLIMDGFDKPLGNGQLTRNLWDQLRELALSPALRLVVASRLRLRELIRHPEAQTSDFWNIFDPTPVHVGCFDEHDLSCLQQRMPDKEFQRGALTELWNESNGFPVLMLPILNHVSQDTTSKMISPDMTIAAAQAVFYAIRDQLDVLWSDCPVTSQDLFRLVLEKGTIPQVEAAVHDYERLHERGFIQVATRKIQRPCRLLERYLTQQPDEGNAMNRLFSSQDSWMLHFKTVLERRIDQISGIDTSLKRYLVRALNDLPVEPKMFLTNVRGIVDCVFDLIWSVEIPDRQIPARWIQVWESNNEYDIDKFKNGFPQGGRRVMLLRLMTGTEKSRACAKYITKETCVLMDAAHEFGNFGQHQNGAEFNAGSAYSVLLICIELSVALTRDIGLSLIKLT